jgi:hypothetical protein
VTGLDRLAAAALALLLGAQGIGKLLDMRLYIVALDRFRAFPKATTTGVAIVWVMVEIVALLGLGASAVKPMRALFIIGAAAAVADALAYAALTIATKLRGIDVLN